MAKTAGIARRSEAASAALGAWWCWAILKGGIVAYLIIKPGDLNSAVGSMEPASVAYAFFFFLFFALSGIMYLALIKSDPGFVDTEEEFTLLEEGNKAQDVIASGSNEEGGVEMQEIDLGGKDSGAGVVGRNEARAKAKADAEDAKAAGSELKEEDADTVGASTKDGCRPRTPHAVFETEIEEADVGIEGLGAGGPPSTVDSATEKLRCKHCTTVQLVRTKHCYDCGRCVYTFDHHCFWIGNCVGERNRRLFWWYIFTEFITVAWACDVSLTTFVYANTKKWARDWVVWNLPSMCVFGLCLGFSLMLGGLLFFHTYLLFTGQTSYEIFRREQIPYMRAVPAEVFPFSEGWRENFKTICCRSSSQPPRRWPQPAEPWAEGQRFWWIENEYWSCF